MHWTILNVSIPVYDLKKSKEFYKIFFPYQEKQEVLYQPIFENEDDIFFGNNGFGLRLFKPKPDLEVDNYIQSRRTYVSILVDDIIKIKNNLEKKNINFIFKNANDRIPFNSLYVQEPSLNLLHFVENKRFHYDETSGWSMGLDWGIHHVNLESLDVRNTINFFSKVINITEGKWVAPKDKGDFSINPTELAILPLSNNNRGLHVIKPDDGFGFRNGFIHNPSIGGHPAFTVKDLSKLKIKLDKKKILYTDARTYAMSGFYQIYLYDINANIIEINQEV